MEKRVAWIKNQQNNTWFDLLRLNLDAPYFDRKNGVYAIWYTAPAVAKMIKIGHGDIGLRLKELRANPAILKFSEQGQLKVTWTLVGGDVKADDLEGIEAYLTAYYRPLLGDSSYSVPQIPVNLIRS